ncbi:MAG: hypothetical protein O3C10_14140 [Chloroflexi bacterium]|nr:hypothetical protein [Chloroflexota bacterium]
MVPFSFRRLILFMAPLVALATACSSGTDDPDAAQIPESALPTPRSAPVATSVPSLEGALTFVIPNIGSNATEGHTPRGFRGSGTGLFAGDNLNSSFPDGDGVQIFLSFSLAGDLTAAPGGLVKSAVLRSGAFTARGSPFQDLGALNAAEMRWDNFSPDLWNAQSADGAASCVFSTSADGPFECDLGPAVQRALDDGYPFAQFRLRFDRASDGDRAADLAMFFLTNSNTNEPGIFELKVELVPAG